MRVGGANITLPPRLSQILAFLDPCRCLADIGSDHGYVIAEAIVSGIAKRGVAVEISQAPYEQTQLTVSGLNLNDVIDVRLGDGLDPLQPGQADAVCIAGMGGKNIVSILSSGKDKLTGVNQLVLQPNVDSHMVRRFLKQQEFVIEKESLVEDGDYIYQVIKAVPGVDEQDYSEVHYTYGKGIIATGGPLFMKLLERDINHWRSVSGQLLNSQNPTARSRRDEVEQKITALRALQN